MTDDEVREWVRRWWDRVWGEGEFDLIDEMVAEDYVRHSSAGTVTGGRARLREDMTQYTRVLHRPVTTVDDLTIDGDKVWFRATSRGANLETGEPTVVTWLGIQRFAAGRLAESWVLTVSGVSWTD